MKNNSLKTAVVLAGGLGTRLLSMVNDRPKPMAEVQKKPFLEHLICYWKSQGIKHFFLLVGHKHELIIEYFKTNFLGCHIDYIIEKKKLGTGGALINFMSKTKIDKPFIFFNGDTYFEVSLKDLENFSLKKKSDISISLFKTSSLSRYSLTELNKYKKGPVKKGPLAG